jgi:hypothetical protein
MIDMYGEQNGSRTDLTLHIKVVTMCAIYFKITKRLYSVRKVYLLFLIIHVIRSDYFHKQR